MHVRKHGFLSPRRFMEGRATGNAGHASQITYTRDKEGRQDSKSRSKKDWLGLIPGGVGMVFFWLHDLIPGYALEQDKWVQKCLLSMFLEWSAVPFLWSRL